MAKRNHKGETRGWPVRDISAKKRNERSGISLFLGGRKHLGGGGGRPPGCDDLRLQLSASWAIPNAWEAIPEKDAIEDFMSAWG